MGDTLGAVVDQRMSCLCLVGEHDPVQECVGGNRGHGNDKVRPRGLPQRVPVAETELLECVTGVGGTVVRGHVARSCTSPIAEGS